MARETKKYLVTGGWYKHPETGEIHEAGVLDLREDDGRQGIADGLLRAADGTKGKAAEPAQTQK